MGHLIDLPKEAAGQGLQALGPLGDGSHPSGNDSLLTAQADNSLVMQLNFPNGLLENSKLIPVVITADSIWKFPVHDNGVSSADSPLLGIRMNLISSTTMSPLGQGRTQSRREQLVRSQGRS